jgi:hypothetical protein
MRHKAPPAAIRARPAAAICHAAIPVNGSCFALDALVAGCADAVLDAGAELVLATGPLDAVAAVPDEPDGAGRGPIS